MHTHESIDPDRDDTLSGASDPSLGTVSSVGRLPTPATPPQDDVAPESFLLRGRRRNLIRLATALGLMAGGITAWQFVPHRVDRLLALTPSRAADDPRGLFPEPSPENRTHQSLHALFDDALPHYLEALRASQIDPRSTTALEQRKAAGAALLATDSDDAALLATLEGLTRASELDLGLNPSSVAQQVGNLNALLRSREWPFVLEGGPTQEERGTFLNLRIYERLGAFGYRTEAGVVQVPVLDRLNLQNLHRLPDPLQSEDGQPVIYARRVWREATSGLLTSLHEGGTFRITALTPSSQTVQVLEKALAQQTYPAWRSVLATSVSETELQALSELSSTLETRNAQYRQINDRDPRKISISYPAGIAGETGSTHLAQLEPYALQGKIRLTIEDLTALRTLDRTLEGQLTRAAPAIKAVQEQLFRREGLRALHARHLRTRPVPEAVLKVAAASLGTPASGLASQDLADPSNPALGQISLQAGVVLSELAEAGPLCQNTLAALGSLALEGSPQENTAARVVVRQLLPNAPDLRPQETLSLSLATLVTQPCERLNQQAREAYVRLYGPYPTFEPTSNTVAAAR